MITINKSLYNKVVDVEGLLVEINYNGLLLRQVESNHRQLTREYSSDFIYRINQSKVVGTTTK